MRDYGVSLEPLFYEARVRYYKDPSWDEQVFGWWKRNEVEDNHLSVQTGYGPTPRPSIRIGRDASDSKGQYDTAATLWKIRQSMEAVAAYLFRASIFELGIGGGRNSINVSAETRATLELHKLLDVKLRGFGANNSWSNSRSVLPGLDFSEGRVITTIDELVAFLSNRQTEALRQFRPVMIQFGPEVGLPISDRWAKQMAGTNV